MKRIFISAVSGIAVLAGSEAAHAQTIDYSALEQLFGEPITASVTGSPKRESEVPASIEIITADEIRRSGARTIPDALRHISGVDVMQWTSDHLEVGMRGYAESYSHRVLVLVDGRQVYADHYGYTPWSAIPVELDAIRQIEIVKGPGAALFGFNAVDGVINIVTYNPLYDDVDVASVAGGTQDLVQGSVISTVRLGPAGLRISGGLRANKDFSTPVPITLGTAGRENNSRGSVDLTGAVQAANSVQLGFGANYSKSDINEVGPSYNLTATYYETYSVQGQAVADTSTGLWQLSVYSNWITVDGPPSALLGELVFKNRLTTVKLQDLVKVGNHTVRAMAEYRHTRQDTTPFKGARVEYKIVSAGGMWDWQIHPSVTLTNALRLDKLWLNREGPTPPGYPYTNSDWDRSYTEVNFNSGLVWNVGEEDILRLTVGRGVHVPSLVVVGGFAAVTRIGQLTGVPTLPPSVIMNYELGWDHRFDAIGAKLRTSLYYNESDDLVALQGGFAITRAGPLLTSITAGNSRAAGIEIGISGTIGENWRWGVNGRYQSIDDDFRPVATLVDFEHVAPRVVVNANIGWTSGPWEVDGFVSLRSKSSGVQPAQTLNTMLVPVPAYGNVDGRVAYRVTDNLTVAVSGQNLTQRAQRQTAGPAIERRVLGTLTYQY